MFWCGVLLDADVTDTGSIDGDKLETLQEAAFDLATRLGTGGNEMVILHSEVGTPTTITSLDVDAVIATQRRRLRQ
jgi:hypothetical protein